MERLFCLPPCSHLSRLVIQVPKWGDMIKHDLCIVQYCIGLYKTVLLLVVPPLSRNQICFAWDDKWTCGSCMKNEAVKFAH